MAPRLVARGDPLPEVPEVHLPEESSWKHLLKDLEEEGRSAGDLMQQMWRFKLIILTSPLCRSGFPKTKKGVVNKIREMLMRSDAFRGSLGWGKDQPGVSLLEF